MKNLIAALLLVVALPVAAQNAPQNTSFGIRLTIVNPVVHNMPVQNHPVWPNAKIQHQDDTSIFQMFDGNSEQAYNWLRTNPQFQISDEKPINASGEWVAQVNTNDQQCLKVHALQTADKSKVRIQTTACF